jgi:hypothetical protein
VVSDAPVPYQGSPADESAIEPGGKAPGVMHRILHAGAGPRLERESRRYPGGERKTSDALQKLFHVQNEAGHPEF